MGKLGMKLRRGRVKLRQGENQGAWNANYSASRFPGVRRDRNTGDEVIARQKSNMNEK